MNETYQHGAVSTYEHVKNVVRISFLLNRRLKLGANEKDLVVGALLHDFYLYDWHHKEAYHTMHGYKHAKFAMDNAVKYFHVNSNVQNIIYSHMWPLNLTHFPKSREALIVCIADKYSSTYETLFCREINKLPKY
jgi:uncharacterized protein